LIDWLDLAVKNYEGTYLYMLTCP